jgi:hypothetical protein
LFLVVSSRRAMLTRHLIVIDRSTFCILYYRENYTIVI